MNEKRRRGQPDEQAFMEHALADPMEQVWHPHPWHEHVWIGRPLRYPDEVGLYGRAHTRRYVVQEDLFGDESDTARALVVGALMDTPYVAYQHEMQAPPPEPPFYANPGPPAAHPAPSMENAR